MRERYTPVSIPERCNPWVRTLFEEMRYQRIGVLDMAERTGINKNTLKDWRTRTVPRITDLEACYNVLGFTLEPKRMTNVPTYNVSDK